MGPLEPADPNVAARVRASFDRQQLLATLGASLGGMVLLLVGAALLVPVAVPVVSSAMICSSVNPDSRAIGGA